MNKIKVFSFNTTNGGRIVLRDVEVSDIVSALREKFPKWTDQAINKIATNKAFYKECEPYNPKEEEKTRKPRETYKTPIYVGEYEINPLLKASKALTIAVKNSSKQWGGSIKETFDVWELTPHFNKFEQKFKQVDAIVADAISESEIAVVTNELCDVIIAFNAAYNECGVTEKNEPHVIGFGKILNVAMAISRDVKKNIG